jgi:hypothetical protein
MYVEEITGEISIDEIEEMVWQAIQKGLDYRMLVAKDKLEACLLVAEWK